MQLQLVVRTPSIDRFVRTCPVLFYKCIRIKGFTARVYGVRVLTDHYLKKSKFVHERKIVG